MQQLNFTTLDDQKDLTFNQLLGINNEGTIAGYFGSGTPAATHPNKGYTLTPPYGQGNYHDENVPGSQQTQVTGLNDKGVTVGFWADPNGDNYGFVEQGGKFFQVVDPNSPAAAQGTPSVNQLLGVNNHEEAVGFYTDAQGNNHGFTYDIKSGNFNEVKVAGATSVTATAVNNEGDVAGFAQIGAATDGFVTDKGHVTLLAGPKGASNVQALGINDNNQVVGSFVGSDGNTHGFLYDMKSHNYTQIDDPNANGSTVVNGLNDKGQLVGFYLDRAGNTDGMLVNVTNAHHVS